MKLKITTEQYNQIQDEIIRLEGELVETFGDLDCDGWSIAHLKDIIIDLKQILNRMKTPTTPYSIAVQEQAQITRKFLESQG